MGFWERSPSGRNRFHYGREQYRYAAEAARQCPSFARDDEEEIVCDEEQSCYNCRYRRWTFDSFDCLKS